MGQIFQREHQGMRAGSAMAECLHPFIQLMRECQAGQGELSPSRLFQRNAHVFDEMFDVEPRVEIAG